MTLEELKDKMEKGITNWGKPMPEYKGKYSYSTPHGYEIANDAVKETIKTYGKYAWPKGGVSYYSIKLKSPIKGDNLEFGCKDIVEIRLDYWGTIMGYREDGSGMGSKHLSAMTLQTFMDKIEEAVSEK